MLIPFSIGKYPKFGKMSEMLDFELKLKKVCKKTPGCSKINFAKYPKRR